MKKSIKFLVEAFVILAASFIMEGGYQVGDKARDFNLKNIDGQEKYIIT